LQARKNAIPLRDLEVGFEVAIGNFVEKPHRLAPGDSPPTEGKVVVVLEKTEGILGLRQNLRPDPQVEMGRRETSADLAIRLDVLPELTAWVEGEELEGAVLGEDCEKTLIERSDVGQAKDEKGGVASKTATVWFLYEIVQAQTERFFVLL
jgi:hypothetical protein